MKIRKQDILTMTAAANRLLELEQGRVSYNRVHKDKTKYNRKKIKKFKLNLESW